ncbi:hypothetical protein [Jiangella asiatica]|uniref:Uncharacterized protein n=1 Tax=Jiangella asiatica TaxID=2530372 RepID=A0A4R5CT39_9ACTN|nr:hypothetical protein [Jiangella asiatica]TDE03446.1 hypothetical protein E1269_20635 [Jiangella asiatica]
MTNCQAMRGDAICGREPARPYTCGPRCRDCTPAVVAGRRDVEPPWEGSLAWFLERAGKDRIGTPQSASQLIDDRAVASGKSRRGAHAYREARMREDERRERELAARQTTTNEEEAS